MTEPNLTGGMVMLARSLRCPACGTVGSLFVGAGGYPTCSMRPCPEPDAASSLLERGMAEAGEPDA